MATDEDQSQIVLAHCDCECDSDDDVPFALADSIILPANNPSQNNNAKRRVSGNLNRSRHHTPQEGEQGRLFRRIVREVPEGVDDGDEEDLLRPQTNLAWELSDLPLESHRPPLSVGAIRVTDLPHPTLPVYQGHNIFGPSRTAEQDILQEWRKYAGLIKEGCGGLAFDVSFHNTKIKHQGPQKQRRAYKLSAIKNRNPIDGEQFKRVIEEKQRKASDRRKRANSAMKERLAIVLQQRKQQVKEKYEEEEDYKQRIAHMKIIEKQSKCAVNREKREREFRQKMEERRRRRDKVRKRARWKVTDDTADENVDHGKQHDDRNSDRSTGDYDIGNNHHGHMDDVDEDEDELMESSPQRPRYNYQF